MRIAIALYRFLTRWLPAAFRADYADAMTASFAERAEKRTGLRRLRFVAGAFADLVATTVAERRTSDRFAGDVVHAVRALRQRPVLSAAVIATLGIGIGATLAVFGLVDAVLMRPLPIASPSRVAGIFRLPKGETEPAGYGLDDGLSYAAFRKAQAESRAFSGVAGFIDVSVGLEISSRTRQLTAGAVSGNYFEVLGLSPSAGRLLLPSDDRLGSAEHVAILGNALWSQAFGRDPRAIGQTIIIGGTNFVVVGVAPSSFRGTRLASQPELWVPLTTIAELRAGGIWNGPLGKRMLGDHPLGWIGTIGRLRNGVSLTSAENEINGLLPRPAPVPGSAETPERLALRTVTESSTLGDRQSLVRFLAILAAVVGITLAIACLNVANLIWAAMGPRAQEFAVRSALGAGRRRLIAQLLLEVQLLALGGGAASLLVCYGTLRLISAFSLPGHIPIAAMHLGLGVPTVLLAGALATVAAFVIGLGPAFAASTPKSSELLRSRSAADVRQPRGFLVTGQAALALVLLVCALLFTRSLSEGLRIDLGFEPDRIAAVSVDLMRFGYTARSARPYYDDVLARVAALPGVEAAALTTHLPLATLGRLPFDAPGGPHTPENPVSAGISDVSPGYFRVMGIPVVEGRVFADTDVSGTPAVAILNAAAARQLFGDRPAVGSEIRIFGAKSATVVGVVRDSKYSTVLDRDVPMVYLNLQQDGATGGVSVLVRTARPAAMVPALRDAVQQVDLHVALYDARAVLEQVDAALAPQRFGALLLGLFSFIGLCVAAVGVYSVVGCTVARRRSELGIRMALGATAADVLRAVLRGIGSAVAAGIVIGLAIAVPVSLALGRFLIDVSPLDWRSFAAASALFVAAAALATAGPARRAIHADPLSTLRSE